MNNNKQVFSGILLTAASAIGFGLLPFFTSFAKNAGMNTWDCLAGRYLGSALVMLLIIRGHRQSLEVAKEAAIKIIIIGIFAFGITSAFLLLGYMHAPTGKVTAIHFLYPSIVMLFSIAAKKEKATIFSIIATIISLIALFMITAPSSASEKMDAFGFLFSACSSISFAAYVLSLDTPLIKSINNNVLVFYLSLSSGLFFLAAAVICASVSVHPPITSSAILPMLGMITLSSALPACFFSLGTRKLGAPASSILSMLEPVTAAIFGAIFLDEALSGMFVIGLVLIIAAGACISFSRMHRSNQ